MSLSDRRSPEAQKYRRLYHTARWRKIRELQFEASPLCERCLKKGLLVPVSVRDPHSHCHHVNAKDKDDPATFFNGPFASLCASCHNSIEQQIERIGYSTEVGEDGWPTDGAHPANMVNK